MESNRTWRHGLRKVQSFIGRLLISCSLLLLLFTSACQAQTFAEWWSQKKTQIKYLGLQIAALKVYGSYLKQGYQISQHGLGDISNWKNGELNLHSSYYRSLKTVNPAIKDDPKASAIVTYATAIPGEFEQLDALDGLSSFYRKYITAVEQKVLAENDKDIAELQLVMTSGKTAMADDERISHLDQLYASAKDKYAFTLSFCNQVKNYLVQRRQQQQDIETERRINEIP